MPGCVPHSLKQFVVFVVAAMAQRAEASDAHGTIRMDPLDPRSPRKTPLLTLQVAPFHPAPRRRRLNAQRALVARGEDLTGIATGFQKVRRRQRLRLKRARINAATKATRNAGIAVRTGQSGTDSAAVRQKSGACQ